MEGLAHCRLCPVGKFTDQVETVTCDDCAEGKYSPEDSTECSNCLSGKSSAPGTAGPTSDQCSLCDNNHVTGEISDISVTPICEGCSVGKYIYQPLSTNNKWADFLSETCIDCWAGTATAQHGGTPQAGQGCQPCDVGSFTYGPATQNVEANSQKADKARFRDVCKTCLHAYFTEIREDVESRDALDYGLTEPYFMDTRVCDEVDGASTCVILGVKMYYEVAQNPDTDYVLPKYSVNFMSQMKSNSDTYAEDTNGFQYQVIGSGAHFDSLVVGRVPMRCTTCVAMGKKLAAFSGDDLSTLPGIVSQLKRIDEGDGLRHVTVADFAVMEQLQYDSSSDNGIPQCNPADCYPIVSSVARDSGYPYAATADELWQAGCGCDMYSVRVVHALCSGGVQYRCEPCPAGKQKGSASLGRIKRNRCYVIETCLEDNLEQYNFVCPYYYVQQSCKYYTRNTDNLQGTAIVSGDFLHNVPSTPCSCSCSSESSCTVTGNADYEVFENGNSVSINSDFNYLQSQRQQTVNKVCSQDRVVLETSAHPSQTCALCPDDEERQTDNALCTACPPGMTRNASSYRGCRCRPCETRDSDGDGVDDVKECFYRQRNYIQDGGVCVETLDSCAQLQVSDSEYRCPANQGMQYVLSTGVCSGRPAYYDMDATTQTKNPRICAPCTGNSEQARDEHGIDVCRKCAHGQRVHDGVCTDCEAGKYHADPDDIQCTECALGTYQNSVGQSDCKTCAAGSYQDSNGKTVCILCGIGKYSSTVGAQAESTCLGCTGGGVATRGDIPLDPDDMDEGCTACLDCPARYPIRHDVSDVSGSPGVIGGWCGDCGQGQKVSQDSGSGYTRNTWKVCELCEVGKKQDTTSHNYASCEMCQAADRKYTTQTGRTVCQNCNAGYAITITSGLGTGCTPCEAGKYSAQPYLASGDCKLCSGVGNNYYSEDTGQSGCERCGPGSGIQVSAAGLHVACTACLAGESTGDDARCGKCQPGTVQQNADDGNPICVNCPVGKTTLLEGQTFCQTCYDCPDGYYNTGCALSTCTPCPSCEVGKIRVGCIRSAGHVNEVGECRNVKLLQRTAVCPRRDTVTRENVQATGVELSEWISNYGLGGFRFEEVFGVSEQGVDFQCRQVCDGSAKFQDPTTQAISYGTADSGHCAGPFACNVQACTMRSSAEDTGDSFRVPRACPVEDPVYDDGRQVASYSDVRRAPCQTCTECGLNSNGMPDWGRGCAKECSYIVCPMHKIFDWTRSRDPLSDACVDCEALSDVRLCRSSEFADLNLDGRTVIGDLPKLLFRGCRARDIEVPFDFDNPDNQKRYFPPTYGSCELCPGLFGERCGSKEYHAGCTADGVVAVKQVCKTCFAHAGVDVREAPYLDSAGTQQYASCQVFPCDNPLLTALAEDGALCVAACEEVVCGSTQMHLPCVLPRPAQCFARYPPEASGRRVARGELPAHANLLEVAYAAAPQLFAGFENVLRDVGGAAGREQCVWNAKSIRDNTHNPGGVSLTFYRSDDECRSLCRPTTAVGEDCWDRNPDIVYSMLPLQNTVVVSGVFARRFLLNASAVVRGHEEDLHALGGFSGNGYLDIDLERARNASLQYFLPTDRNLTGMSWVPSFLMTVMARVGDESGPAVFMEHSLALSGLSVQAADVRVPRDKIEVRVFFGTGWTGSSKTTDCEQDANSFSEYTAGGSGEIILSGVPNDAIASGDSLLARTAKSAAGRIVATTNDRLLLSSFVNSDPERQIAVHRLVGGSLADDGTYATGTKPNHWRDKACLAYVSTQASIVCLQADSAFRRVFPPTEDAASPSTTELYAGRVRTFGWLGPSAHAPSASDYSERLLVTTAGGAGAAQHRVVCVYKSRSQATDAVFYGPVSGGVEVQEALGFVLQYTRARHDDAARLWILRHRNTLTDGGRLEAVSVQARDGAEHDANFDITRAVAIPHEGNAYDANRWVFAVSDALIVVIVPLQRGAVMLSVVSRSAGTPVLFEGEITTVNAITPTGVTFANDQSGTSSAWTADDAMVVGFRGSVFALSGLRGTPVWQRLLNTEVDNAHFAMVENAFVLVYISSSTSVRAMLEKGGVDECVEGSAWKGVHGQLWVILKIGRETCARVCFDNMQSCRAYVHTRGMCRLYQETSAQSFVDACVLENALQLDAVHALERDGQVDVAMSWSVVAIVPNVVVVPKSGTGQGFHVLRGDGNIVGCETKRLLDMNGQFMTWQSEFEYSNAVPLQDGELVAGRLLQPDRAEMTPTSRYTLVRFLAPFFLAALRVPCGSGASFRFESSRDWTPESDSMTPQTGDSSHFELPQACDAGAPDDLVYIWGVQCDLATCIYSGQDTLYISRTVVFYYQNGHQQLREVAGSPAVEILMLPGSSLVNLEVVSSADHLVVPPFTAVTSLPPRQERLGGTWQRMRRLVPGSMVAGVSGFKSAFISVVKDGDADAAQRVHLDDVQLLPLLTLDSKQSVPDLCPPGMFSGWISCQECAAGKFASTRAATACTDCAAGKFQASTRSTGCELCPAASASAAVGASHSGTCELCAAGSFAGPGSARCQLCPVGKYCAGTFGAGERGAGADIDCLPCPAGTFNSEPGIVVVAQCAGCGVGSYSLGGASSCTLCPPGFFNNDTRATDASACRACPAGTYSVGNASSCTLCPANTFQPVTEAGSEQSCVPCPSGSSLAGSTAQANCSCGLGFFGLSVQTCAACPTGATSGLRALGIDDCRCVSGSGRANGTEGGAWTCQPCPAGSAGVDGVCEPCKMGSYSAVSASTACDLCPVGMSSAAGATSCVFTTCEGCPVGTYSQTVGSSDAGVCKPCAPGYFAVGSAIECEPCPTGTYSNVSGVGSAAECKRTPAGFYTSDLASVAPTPCAAGFVSSTLGATSIDTCLPCPAGTASVEGSTQCTECVAGSYADVPGSAECTACAGGKFGVEVGAVAAAACENCAAGMYSAAGSTVCLACAWATWSEAGSAECSLTSPDSTDHLNCPPGRAVFNSEHFQGGSFHGVEQPYGCLPCGVGKFSAEWFHDNKANAQNYMFGIWFCGGRAADGSLVDGQTENCDKCTQCPGRTHAPSEGAVQCVPCPAGSVPSADRASCESCPAGTFAEELGSQAAYEGASASCAPCAAGSFSVAGQAECVLCEANFYALAGASACTACPRGLRSRPGSVSVQQCVYEPDKKRLISMLYVPSVDDIATLGLAADLLAESGYGVSPLHGNNTETWERLHVRVALWNLDDEFSGCEYRILLGRVSGARQVEEDGRLAQLGCTVRVLQNYGECFMTIPTTMAEHNTERVVALQAVATELRCEWPLHFMASLPPFASVYECGEDEFWSETTQRCESCDAGITTGIELSEVCPLGFYVRGCAVLASDTPACEACAVPEGVNMDSGVYAWKPGVCVLGCVHVTPTLYWQDAQGLCQPCSEDLRSVCRHREPFGQRWVACTESSAEHCESCPVLSGFYAQNEEFFNSSTECETRCKHGFFRPVGEIACVPCTSLGALRVEADQEREPGVFYRFDACTLTSDTQKRNCEIAGVNGFYSADALALGEDCVFECFAGFQPTASDPPVCSACPDPGLPVDSYRFVSIETACQIECLEEVGFYPRAGSCVNCSHACSVGEFANASADGCACSPCTRTRLQTSPVAWVFTSPGSVNDHLSCEESCPPGYMQDFDRCQPHSAFACGYGFFRAPGGQFFDSECHPCSDCEGRRLVEECSPSSDVRCVDCPAPGLNERYVGSNCSRQCVDGHLRNSRTQVCEFCLEPCALGFILAELPANCSDCLACPVLPEGAQFVGGPDGGCRWSCDDGLAPLNGQCVPESAMRRYWAPFRPSVNCPPAHGLTGTGQCVPCTDSGAPHPPLIEENTTWRWAPGLVCETECLRGYQIYRPVRGVVQCLTLDVYVHTLGIHEVPASIQNMSWPVQARPNPFSALTLALCVAGAGLLSMLVWCW